MLIQYKDFNGADQLVEKSYPLHWDELKNTIESMPLHLKSSDQDKKKGKPIFDVKGINEYLKSSLGQKGWLTNVPIPAEFNFWGTDVDFVKDGIVTEVQFSNYPFLLSNIFRTEIFFRAGVRLSLFTPELLVVVTKSNMFPASNSTLYFERALEQTILSASSLLPSCVCGKQ